MLASASSHSGGKRLHRIRPEHGTDHPLVTVITAVFNARDTLEATIQSVLAQTYPNIEYLVIDGGSTDGTVDVIRRYDHAIDYWVSEPDKGVYDAMNKGVRASTGEWLNLLNANDVFSDPTAIQRVANCFSGNARFIYSDVLLRTAGDALVRYTCDHNRLIINHQASIYRKSLHEDHGLYLVKAGVTISDYLFFSLLARDEFAKAADPIAIYDTTGLSQSRRAADQKFVVDFLINGIPVSYT